MSLKLLSISSMYSGYLDSFYFKNPSIRDCSYNEHINLLIEETTEFAGSYIRNFRKSGIEAECIIANDTLLQIKWSNEKGIKSDQYDAIIFNQVEFHKPDVLWIENLNQVNNELIEKICQKIKSVKLVVAYHCAPFNAKIINNLKWVDFVITCTPGLKSIIEGMGKRTYLVYHGFDEALLSKTNEAGNTFENDFIFSGSLISGGDFHSKRISLIQQILDNNINIGLYVNLEKQYKIRAKQSIYLLSTFFKKTKLDRFFEGSNLLAHGKTWVDMYSASILRQKRPPVFGIEMYNLFSNSKIVLNFHIGVAGDYAGNMRMFEVTGAGSCLLTDNKKNMRDLFDTETEVVVYDSPDDCIAKVRWLLENEEERKKIAYSGQRKTLEFHTVRNRCASIIDILNSELDNRRKKI